MRTDPELRETERDDPPKRAGCEGQQLQAVVAQPSPAGAQGFPLLDTRACAVVARLARACSGFVIALSAVILLGWILGQPQLVRLGLSTGAMAPNSSIGLLAAGASLYLLLSPTAKRLYAARALAAISLLLGGLTLIEYLGRIDLGIDQRVLADSMNLVHNRFPGRMTETTAIMLVLAGSALLILGGKSGRRLEAGLWLSVPLYLLVLFLLFGLQFDARRLQAVSGATGIAWTTVVAMLALATGIFFARPGSGPAAILCAAGDGGFLARRLLPAAALLPPGLAWLLQKQSERLDFGIDGFATLSAIVTVMILTGLSWWLARLVEQRHQVQQAMASRCRRNELLLNQAQEASHIGGWEVDVISGCVTWTPEVYRIHEMPFDHDPSDREPAQRCYAEGDRQKLVAALAGACESGEPYDLECEFRTARGNPRWVRTSGRAERENGRIVRVHGYIADVTEHRTAEERIRESERRFRSVLDSLPQLIWTCAPDGPCDYLSSQWVAYTGIAEAIQLGSGWLEQIHPDDRAGLQARWAEAVKTGGAYDTDFRIRRADGEYRWFKTRAIPLQDGNRRIVKWFGSCTDLHDRVLAEAEVRELNASLEQRVAERTRLLEAANQELEAFAYSVSHDLRAPLRSIDGFANLLEEDYGPRFDEDGKDALRRVRANAQKMATLIDDLLKLSRLSRAAISAEALDLSEIARSVAAGLGAAEPGRQVSFDIAPSVAAYGDRRLLTVVLDNLLGNAWKFTGKHASARIEFGAGVDEGQPMYYVRDDGAGFDMAHVKNLFAPFQRLHGTAEFPGTGIGLSIVRRIVQRHGGRIWAEGAVEKGATFCFTLSSAPAELQSGDTHARSQ